MAKTIRRVLKRALDAEELRIITSDELLKMSAEAYQQIRRGVTIGVKTGAARYLCSRCGHPVYAPNYRTGPGWKHYGREPIDCEWWTGKTSSVDEVSARQFQGQQESPLHNKVKNLVADLLRADSRVTDVVVDEVLHGSTGYKKPDVRAEFGGRPIAVELQLSTTQIPVIVERELFYRHEGRHLIWLTWDFEPRPYAEVRQAFRDIATAHHENLFTLDAQAIAESRRRSCLVFRVLWWRGGVCHEKLVTLNDLVWCDDGLPFAVARPKPAALPLSSAVVSPGQPTRPKSRGLVFSVRSAEKFKERWVQRTEELTSWQLFGDDLWLDLLEVAGVNGLQHDHEKASVVIDVLNLALSFECGYPVGSRQTNLAELLTTFLATERRHPYALLAKKLAGASGHAELLERSAIKKKIETAMLVTQLGGSSDAVKVLTVLFPQWVKRKDTGQIEADTSSP